MIRKDTLSKKLVVSSVKNLFCVLQGIGGAGGD